MNKYPLWICHDCGMKAEHDKRKINSCATYHEGECDVCQKMKAVTQPRDYGHPDPEAFIWKKGMPA